MTTLTRRDFGKAAGIIVVAATAAAHAQAQHTTPDDRARDTEEKMTDDERFSVPEWEYALRGLDQESGIQLDVKQWGAEAFTDTLRKAYRDGKFYPAGAVASPLLASVATSTISGCSSGANGGPRPP